MDTAADHRETSAERMRHLLAVVGELARELHPQHGRAAKRPCRAGSNETSASTASGGPSWFFASNAPSARACRSASSPKRTPSAIFCAPWSKPGRRERRSRRCLRASLAAVPAAAEARTLLDVLEWHVAQHPERVHVTVLEDEATVIGTLTYGELAKAARDRSPPA